MESVSKNVVSHCNVYKYLFKYVWRTVIPQYASSWFTVFHLYEVHHFFLLAFAYMHSFFLKICFSHSLFSSCYHFQICNAHILAPVTHQP